MKKGKKIIPLILGILNLGTIFGMGYFYKVERINVSIFLFLFLFLVDSFIVIIKKSEKYSDFTKKIYILTWGSLILFVVLILRLFQIQVINHEKYHQMAESQSKAEYYVEGNRGSIMDRNGRELAYDVNFYDVILDPLRFYGRSDREAILSEFSKIFLFDEKKVRENLKEKYSLERRYFKIGKKISESDKEKIDELLKKYQIRNKEVYFEVQNLRNYPADSYFAHLIGFVGYGENKEKRGVFGIEGFYDKYLKSRKFLESGYFSNSRKIKIPTEEGILPNLTNGRNVELTIDYTIQFYLNEALKEGFEKTQATNAWGIVMNPNTGEILASASYPFEGNNALLRNRMIHNQFEPGSIFKPLFMAAAYEDKIVNDSSRFENLHGYFQVGRNRIHDSDGHHTGILSPSDVITFSSNVGMAMIAEKVEKKWIEDWLRKFGVYDPTGVDLVGELKPRMSSSDKWDGFQKYTISYGQSMVVTPLQMISAFASLINGGNLYKPHLLKRITESDGSLVRENKPELERRVFSEETAEKMKSFLVRAANEGTGKNALIDGYTIGGKTGTAYLTENGGYLNGEYLSSFMGFFPAENPKYLILISLEKPQAPAQYLKYGGWTAAPVFKNVAEKIVKYDRIPATKVSSEVKTNENVVKKEKQPDYTYVKGELPDFTGWALRDVLAFATENDIRLDISGNGKVVLQEPAKGSSIIGLKLLTIKLE